MTSKYTLFTTLSLNKELYFKVLNDNTLPFEPSFFDRYTSKIKSDGSTYILEWIEVKNYNYSLLIEYRNLNKTTKEYLAVGALISNQITVNESIVFYQMIAEVHANLLAYRDENGKFSSSFNINNYSYKPKDLTLDSAYLVDTLCKVSMHDGSIFPKDACIEYNDIAFKDKIISSKDFLFIGNNGVKEIEKIKEQLESLEQENRSQKELIDSIENITTKTDTPKNDSKEKTFREKYFWLSLIISLILGFLISLPFSSKEPKVSSSSISEKENIPFPSANLDSKFYKNNLFEAYSSTWYVYSRILELKDEQYKDIQNKIKEKFKKNPNDKYKVKRWKKLLNLKPLGKTPKEKDKKQGILAIWECTIDSSKQGHIGFVEDISEDGKKYRLSDFDRLGKDDNEFRDEIYTFPKNHSDKTPQNGYLGTLEKGCFPMFYKI